MSDSSIPLIRCSYCRGLVPGGEAECMRCGAPLTLDLLAAASSFEEFVEAANQKLIESGTSAAELAFGVGCTLGVLVAVVLMVIIFLVFTRTWTTLVVILFILTLISFLVSSILAIRAREATTSKTYQREVEPAVADYILKHGISRDQFSSQAKQIIPASSPLLAFIKLNDSAE
jgi:ABC-type multidrug transport system fused ATPase/permease subunit